MPRHAYGIVAVFVGHAWLPAARSADHRGRSASGAAGSTSRAPNDPGARVDLPARPAYLYFADRRRRYIRLACSDHRAGPWMVHPPGAIAFVDPPPVDLAETSRAVRSARGGARNADIARALAEITTPHIASSNVDVGAAGRRHPHILPQARSRRERRSSASRFRTMASTSRRGPAAFEEDGRTYVRYAVTITDIWPS